MRLPRRFAPRNDIEKKLPVTFFTYKMKKKFVFLYEMLMERLT